MQSIPGHQDEIIAVPFTRPLDIFAVREPNWI
jgi:hypothetical protein